MHVGVKLVYLLALSMACAHCACQRYDPCRTMNGQPAFCVPFVECPEMDAYLKSSFTLYPKGLKTLVAHLGSCGSSTDTAIKDALVCCESPIPSTTAASQTTTISQYVTVQPPPSIPSTTETPITVPDGILPKICGRMPVATHIYGGVEDEELIHRWSVFLDLGSKGQTRCSGSVITDRHVLTAAHCLDNKQLHDITMYFGLYDLREKDKCLKDNSCQKRKPSKLFIHEMYKPNSNMQIDDIAMIRFDQPLNFTDFIEPICLPLKVTYDKSFEQEKENGNVFNVLAFGWGEMGGGVLSNTRRVVMLNVTTHDKCENSASSKTMCTFGVKERQDVCQGDSGSALVWLYKKQMYVVGVATYGPPCGMDPDRPSIAMRISYYIEWIKKAIMSELVN